MVSKPEFAIRRLKVFLRSVARHSKDAVGVGVNRLGETALESPVNERHCDCEQYKVDRDSVI